MHKRRRAYVYQVDILIQDFMMIQVYVCIKIVLLLDTLCLSGDNIYKGCNPATLLKSQIGFDMRVRDSAGSDNCYVNHSHHLILMFFVHLLYSKYRKK